MNITSLIYYVTSGYEQSTAANNVVAPGVMGVILVQFHSYSTAQRWVESVPGNQKMSVESMKEVPEKQGVLARMLSVLAAYVVFRLPIVFLFEIRFAIG
jgi:hypothetical protein